MKADCALRVFLEDWLSRESSAESLDDKSLFRCREFAGDERVPEVPS